MRFVRHAPVYSANKDEVGRITRFVVHPATKRLTHLVIQRGLIFTSDHVLPLELVDYAISAGTILHDAAGDVQDFPKFEETLNVLVELAWDERTAAFSPVGMLDYQLVPETRFIEQIRRNIPDNTLALQAVARVTSEDHHAVGHIDTLHVDPANGHITHITIVYGRQMRIRQRVPAFWCRFIAEDEVYIPVDTDSLHALLEEARSYMNART